MLYISYLIINIKFRKIANFDGIGSNKGGILVHGLKVLNPLNDPIAVPIGLIQPNPHIPPIAQIHNLANKPYLAPSIIIHFASWANTNRTGQLG